MGVLPGDVAPPVDNRDIERRTVTLTMRQIYILREALMGIPSFADPANKAAHLCTLAQLIELEVGK